MENKTSYYQWCTVLMMALCMAVTARAQDVTRAQARDIAAHFLNSCGIAAPEPKHVAQRRSPAASEKNEPYYIFNAGEEAAFVVVSGDSRTQQVLAYSTEGAFDTENIAPGTRYMLQMYEDYINSIQGKEYLAPARKAAPASDDGKGKRLYTAKWNQSNSFWWQGCPMLDNNNTHAGCVATAMAIIMRYHEWPATTGQGSKTYTWNGTDLYADFGATNYAIPTLPTGNERDSGWTDECQERVATLLYHCGVAVNMDYGIYGSASSTEGALVGLWRYFGYDLGYSVSLTASNYDEWLETVKGEIDAGYPLIYDGSTDYNAGHAFICEGYDNEDHLYFNFGWGGYNNGYYAIMPSQTTDDGDKLHEFCYDQKAFFNLRPHNDGTPQEFHDLRLNHDSDCTGLQFDGNTITRGKNFKIKARSIINIADRTLNAAFAMALHKEGDEDKFISKQGGIENFQAGHWIFSTMNFTCNLPYDYTPDEDDYIYLAYSTDEGNTWRKMPCVYPDKETIAVAQYYDPSEPQHLSLLVNPEGESGLSVRDGSSINNMGEYFIVMAHHLCNEIPVPFDGEVSIQICDTKNKPIMEIGKSTISGLAYNVRYAAYYITCSIPAGTKLVKGSRLCLFSRYQGTEDWLLVKSSDNSVPYLDIPFADEEPQYDNLIAIVKDWKWISTFLATPVDASILFEKGVVRVQSQTQESVQDATLGIVGNLPALQPGVGYKVNSTTSFTLSLTGYLHDTGTHPIMLEQGWNWIGYPYHESCYIADAVTNAEDGDYICSQYGYTEYRDGAWKGTIDRLDAGLGYLYKSVSAKALALDFTAAGDVTRQVRQQLHASTSQLPVYRYPNTMNVTARLYRDAIDEAEGNYKVTAYCGEELRGEGVLLDGIHYITIYGDEEVPVRLVAQDMETGETFDITTQLQFTSDVLGSRKSPCALTLGESTGIASHGQDDSHDGIYTLDGVRLDNITRPGIYIIRRGGKVEKWNKNK